MFKKRYFSVKSDFKTGLLCKIAFFLGLIFLIVSIFFIISSFIIDSESSGFLQDIYAFSQTTYPQSLLAFSIIFFAFGFILYFFHCQFAKLAKIADEIEKGEDFEDLSES
jgi:amino acid permease